MKKFDEYHVSEKTGFIINQKETIHISEYYNPWIVLKRDLETLIISGTLVKYVEEMQVLYVDHLLNDEERRYCRCILAMATAAFVWHQRDIYVPKILPRSLAVPLRRLSDYFGLMPILTHTDMVIMNTFTDEFNINNHDKCISIKEQIRTNINWTVFQRETARVELCFAPAISAIGNLYQSIENDHIEETISCLRIILDVLQAMKNTMKRFNEMDPNYFHLEMRPYLVGWSGESFPDGGGLLYENEDGTHDQIECIGASAAQSPTLQTLDSLFNIEHSKDNQNFFDSMKMYMLKGHREFIADVRRFIKLDEFVDKNNDNPVLIESFNGCLNGISSYRAWHMQTVARFILKPAKEAAKSSSKNEFLQEKGTGGQDLIKFLKEVKKDVQKRAK